MEAPPSPRLGDILDQLLSGSTHLLSPVSPIEHDHGHDCAAFPRHRPPKASQTSVPPFVATLLRTLHSHGPGILIRPTHRDIDAISRAHPAAKVPSRSVKACPYPMKFLDYPELEALSRALTFESAECKVFTRLEAYSCKAVNKEKRLFKALESAYQQTASTSPPDYLEETMASPFGRLDQPSARKTLFLLIALLNGVFPDHDFSQVNPSDFRREPSPAMVLHSLSTTLHSLRSNSGAPRSYSTLTGSFSDINHDFAHLLQQHHNPSHRSAHASSSSSGPGSSPLMRKLDTIEGATHAGLASLLDDIMDIRDCDVFTFHPDTDSDPHACPEPDEEGFGFDDRAGYWSDDDDEQMQTVNVVTPRRRGSTVDLDTPMFDEDLDGGFAKTLHSPGRSHTANTGAYAESDEPLTPHSTASRRAGDTSSTNRGAHRIASPSRNRNAGRDTSFSLSSSSLSSSSSVDIDDDEDDGIGGLLWSTYAFFYNRRLKRVLFVSVWSRMNNSSLGWTSPLAHVEPALSIPPMLSLPGAVTSPRLSSATTKKSTRGAAAAAAPAAPAAPTHISPAKIALTRGRKGRRRVASGSPAPSSLSPFPHASPQAPRTPSNDTEEPSWNRAGVAGALATGRPGQPAPTHPISLDGAALSLGAAANTPPSIMSAKRAGDSDAPQGKRLRRQAVV
ncbi:unnamed protein product [Parajaminaea phylloscopi]